jgi:DNA-binding GntR family transcriptional regulator
MYTAGMASPVDHQAAQHERPAQPPYIPRVPRKATRHQPQAVRDGASRAELVYTNLRAAIHAGRFEPGERIREADVAAWLGVSRTPVRDALKRLESDGILASAPRRGLIVAELDQQQVSELYSVRDVLEGLAGRLAAQHATSAEVAAMRDLLERQARTRDEDSAALVRLNQLFHEVVSRAARNRYLSSMLDAFQSSLALLPGTTYSAAGRPASALTEHTELVDAIEHRDAERAEHLARDHMRAAERIRQLMISGGEPLIGGKPHAARTRKKKR